MPRRVILFTFGRLNPGTPGHLALLKAMIDEAIRYIEEEEEDIKPEIFFTLSNTQGGADNPFFCEGDEQGKIYKKNLFVEMIIEMVKQTYRDQDFIINGRHVGPGNTYPIPINVNCSQSVFTMFDNIFPGEIPEDTRVQLFFGSDQVKFAEIIKTNLEKKNIPTGTEIIQRKKLDGCVDLKTLSVDKICEFFAGASQEDAAKACSSSVVKLLARDYTGLSCSAIETLYAPYLNRESITQMITELNAILTAPPAPPKPKVIKSKSTGSIKSTTFKKPMSPKGSPTGSPRVSLSRSPKGDPGSFVSLKKVSSPGSPKGSSFVIAPRTRNTRTKTQVSTKNLGGGKTRKNKRKNKRNKKLSKRRK
jgi:hypothetical protein